MMPLAHAAGLEGATCMKVLLINLINVYSCCMVE